MLKTFDYTSHGYDETLFNEIRAKDGLVCVGHKRFKGKVETKIITNLGILLNYSSSDGNLETFIIRLGDNDTTIKINLSGTSSHRVSVATKTVGDIDKHMARLSKLFQEVETEKDTVPVRFWYNSPHGPSSRNRTIKVSEWDDIKNNYNPVAQDSVSDLMKYDANSENGLILWTGEPGTGKAQPLDAKILTPTGWKLMKDMAVGDTVINPEGGYATVNGVFPQGERDIYKATFSDGSSTECDSEHLWNFRSRRDQPWKTETLSSVQGKDLSVARKYIPLVTPMDFEDTELPIDPYFLGLILGDGTLTSDSIGFSNIDEELLTSVRQNLKSYGTLNLKKCVGINCDYRMSLKSGEINRHGNPLWTELSKLGLRGQNSFSKFIPNSYKFSSAQNRLELLRGLLDTDGGMCVTSSLKKNGEAKIGYSCEYSTSSSKLALDVQFLVQSMGGTCTISERYPSYTYKGETLTGSLSYRMCISLPPEVIPFKLTRKAEVWKNRQRSPIRRLTDIKFIGKKEAQCISLDSKNQLYVTDDFIVTHNTTAIRALANSWQKWCNISVITDPEVFLNNVSYLNDVMFEEDEIYVEGEFIREEPRPVLLILEDAGELITVHAKQETGQALSRLLNVADGLLGQGVQLFILITTNEYNDNLHPAIQRPGRCVSQLEFGEFTEAEAQEWLDAHKIEHKAKGYMSIANLYALLHGKNTVINSGKRKNFIGFAVDAD